MDAVVIVCGRCEFLGSLFAGEMGDTKSIHFVAYAQRFLEPVNAAWRGVHNVSGAGHSASEFHGSFRARALAGSAPPPHVLVNPEKGTAGFSVAHDEADRARHLLLALGDMPVHAPSLLAEFAASMAGFAACLRENRDLLHGSPLKPVERFRRGLWWRLRPSGLATKVWASEGAARGIPAG
ncbi:MAG: hypothetical protein ACRELB_03935 [Polyangiaceae bacterium]